MQHLLSHLTEKLDTYYRQSSPHKEFYNIFKVLRVTEKEVIMCRMLADLLDPRGVHGQGNIFLKSFLEQVLEMECATEQLESATVHKEYPIPESDRRIDIAIQMKNRFIPIEVKINAKDQNGQCYDYWTFSSKKMGDEEAVIYYLTKYGTVPSDESITSGNNRLSTDKVKLISFEKDIRDWLKNCAAISGNNIKLFIKQYLEAIEDFTGALDEDIAKVTIDTILSCREFFESALLVEKTMKDAKVSLMNSMFEEFERQMDYAITNLPFKMSRMDDAYCYYYKKQADSYYNKKWVYPSISYSFDDIKFLGKKKLLLHITVNEYLYAGIVLYDESVSDEVKSISKGEEKVIKEHIKVNDIESDCDFGYLPNLTGEEDLSDENVPNFDTMQGILPSFIDNKVLVAFVEKSVNKIKDKLIEMFI